MFPAVAGRNGGPTVNSCQLGGRQFPKGKKQYLNEIIECQFLLNLEKTTSFSVCQAMFLINESGYATATAVVT